MMMDIQVVAIIGYSLIGVLIGAFCTGVYLHEKHFDRQLGEISRTHTIIWESMMREKDYNKLLKENEQLKKVIIDNNIKGECNKDE